MERALPASFTATRVSGSLYPSYVRAASDLDYRIYPLRAMRFEVPDYAVYDGLPSSTPQAMCLSRVTTSASGKAVADKSPEELVLGSTRRWIASTGYSATRWLPVSPVANESYYWSTRSEYAPEQVVRTWTERVSGYYRSMSRTALAFSVGGMNHLWASFPVQSIEQFMVTLVIDPYDSASRYAVLDTGSATPLSYPDSQSADDFLEPDANRSYLHAVRVRGTTIAEMGVSGGTTLQTSGMDIASQWPVVCAIVGRRSSIDLYAWNHNGPAPKLSGADNSVKSISRTKTPYSTQFLLGRANGTLAQCAQMALFDVGWWERAPEHDDVVDIMAKLRSAYQVVVAS